MVGIADDAAAHPDRGVDDRIGNGQCRRETRRVGDVAEVGLAADADELLRRLLGPRQADDVVTRLLDGSNDGAADVAGGTGDEHAHGDVTLDPADPS
jgi:hypothetical protein